MKHLLILITALWTLTATAADEPVNPLELASIILEADTNTGEARVPAPQATIEVTATNITVEDYSGRMSVELYRVVDLGFMQITRFHASVTRQVEVPAGTTVTERFVHADLNEGDEFLAMVTYIYNDQTVSDESNVVGPAIYTITAAQPHLDVNNDNAVNAADVNIILDYILKNS